MKMTDLRAKARAIFGPAFAEPMPNQPNGAKALQQRANARPIPTYKVGGVVKKPMPTPADLAAAKAQNEMIKKATVSKKDAAAIAAGNRASGLEGAEMRKMRMKDGGKMPDLTGDGKVTRADVLKGRGVKGFAMGGVQTSSDTARKLASEMGGMKKGGKVKEPVELVIGGADTRGLSLGMPSIDIDLRRALTDKELMDANLNAVRAKETSDAAKGKSFGETFAAARRDQGPNGVFTWRGKSYNTKMAGETSKAAPARAAAPAAAPNRRNPPAAAAPASRPAATPPAAPASRPAAPAAAAPVSRPAATPPPAATPTRGATTPPATPRAAPANKSGNANSSTGLGGAINRGVGAIQDQMSTQARNMAKNREENPDIFTRIANTLSERRKIKADSAAAKEAARRDYDAKAGRAGIGVMLERPPRSVNYAKGGKVKEPKPKNGLAVMIAIGKPMKPAKKMNGGPMAAGSMDREASKVTREMAMGGDPMGYMGGGAPMGYAAGGAGKTRKGQAPIKKAQGGAAKVRKGMMTPEGDIINAMNKMRGK